MTVIDLPTAGRSRSRTSLVREPTAEELAFRRVADVMESFRAAWTKPVDTLEAEADRLEQGVRQGLALAVRDHPDELLSMVPYYGRLATRARIFRAVLKERAPR